MIAAVYADGGCIQSNPSDLGGTWAWVQERADGSEGLAGSGLILAGDYDLALISNNVTEYAALTEALASLPDGWSGRVCSDSQVTLGRFFREWRCAGIPGVMQTRAAQQRRRLGALTPVLLCGHPTRAELAAGIGKRGYPVSRFNVLADRACTALARDFMAKRAGAEVAVAG